MDFSLGEFAKNIGLTISEKIENLQEDFLQKNIGEAINNAVDTGLKIILPDYIEDEIIEIKDAFLKEGFIEGIKTAIEVTINKGKEIMGMFTGNLENMTQAEAIIKNGDLITNVANVLEDVVDKCVKNDLISETIGDLIKSGKNIILDNAKNNIKEFNKEQLEKIKEMDELIEDWEKAFKQQDFKKMQSAYTKIKNRLEKVLPVEETINKARTVENLHNLIKNNDKNFDLTEEQLQLAQQLV